MSAMSDLDVEVNEALDAYIEYMKYDNKGDGHYESYEEEELRWNFIDAAVELLEKFSNRKVEDELNG